MGMPRPVQLYWCLKSVHYIQKTKIDAYFYHMEVLNQKAQKMAHLVLAM